MKLVDAEAAFRAAGYEPKTTLLDEPDRSVSYGHVVATEPAAGRNPSSSCSAAAGICAASPSVAGLVSQNEFFVHFQAEVESAFMLPTPPATWRPRPDVFRP
jgi:hypothetical protein